MFNLSFSQTQTERFTNYKKQLLSSKEILIKDSENIQKPQRLKVTFVPEFETDAIYKLFRDSGFEHLCEIKPALLNKNLSLAEISEINKPVYEYFNMSMSEWLNLELLTEKAFRCLYDFLKNKDENQTLGFDDIFSSLSEYLAQADDVEAVQVFRKLPIEQQELLAFHVLNMNKFRIKDELVEEHIEKFLEKYGTKLSDYSGVLITGQVGSGKSLALRVLVGTDNIFFPDVEGGATFSFTESVSPFVALDETEYFSLADLKDFYLAALKAGKTPLFSAQHGPNIEGRILSVLSEIQDLKPFLLIDISDVLPLFIKKPVFA